MREFKYNLGKKKNGLYCDINNVGQAYNVELLLKSVSKNKTGLVRISFKNRKGYLRARKSEFDNGWSAHYYLDKPVKYTHQFSLDRNIANARVIYIKIIPSKST